MPDPMARARRRHREEPGMVGSSSRESRSSAERNPTGKRRAPEIYSAGSASTTQPPGHLARQLLPGKFNAKIN